MNIPVLFVGDVQPTKPPTGSMVTLVLSLYERKASRSGWLGSDSYTPAKNNMAMENYHLYLHLIDFLW